MIEESWTPTMSQLNSDSESLLELMAALNSSLSSLAVDSELGRVTEQGGSVCGRSSES